MRNTNLHNYQKFSSRIKLTKRRLQQCVDILPTILRRMYTVPKEWKLRFITYTIFLFFFIIDTSTIIVQTISHTTRFQWIHQRWVFCTAERKSKPSSIYNYIFNESQSIICSTLLQKLRDNSSQIIKFYLLFQLFLLYIYTHTMLIRRKNVQKNIPSRFFCKVLIIERKAL